MAGLHFQQGGSPSARNPPRTSTYKKRMDLTRITNESVIRADPWGCWKRGFCLIQSMQLNTQTTRVLTAKLFNIVYQALLTSATFYTELNTSLKY